MKKKISTAEHAETAELFLCKGKNYKSFYRSGPLFAFQTFASREEGEGIGSRERKDRSLKTLGGFGLPSKVRTRAAFLAASWP
jgi:hypothetical protein